MGAAPAPVQEATNPNRNFDGAPPVGTKFPLTQTIMQANNLGGNIVPHALDYTTSLTFTNLGFRFEGSDYDVQVLDDGTPVTTPNTINTETGEVRLQVTQYFHYFFGGVWSIETSNYFNFSPFFTGYATPNNAIPTGGNATYSRAGGVLGDVLIAQGSDLAGAELEGDITLNVAFGTVGGVNSGQLTGTFTNVEAIDEKGNRTAWNNVALTGSAEGGSAEVTSSPSTPFALKSGASGMYGGDIYGPNAEEIGAIWFLRNADGSALAEGVFGAEKGYVFTTPPPWMMSLISFGNTTAGYWSGVANPVFATPAPASAPSSPTVISGEERFDSVAPNSGAFPLTMTAMKNTSNGFAVDTATNTQGATLTVTNGGAPYSSTSLRLVIPSLGVDTTFNKMGKFADPGMESLSGGQAYDLSTFGLSYTGFGRWEIRGNPGPAVGNGTFVFGYETPIGSMPASGTAAYKGTGTVAGIVDVSKSGNGQRALVGGDANLAANFGTGQVSGSLTNMIATTDGKTAQPWNNVSVSASIAAGTNSFSGSTGAATAPAGTYTLKGTANGHIDGAFYGPNANELGAVWTLSNGDGTGAAIGVVGGTKQ